MSFLGVWLILIYFFKVCFSKIEDKILEDSFNNNLFVLCSFSYYFYVVIFKVNRCM